jgi:magnesium transporter
MLLPGEYLKRLRFGMILDISGTEAAAFGRIPVTARHAPADGLLGHIKSEVLTIMSRRTGRKRHNPRFRRQTKPGASPGTIRAQPDAAQPIIRVLAYSQDEIVEQQIDRVDQIPRFLAKYPVTWINVDGLGNVATIQALGELFDLHPLTLEDVVHVHQRAKVEPFEEHLYVVARMVKTGQHLETEQVSLFLGPNYVLTFQEQVGDCFDPVRERIRQSGGRVRRVGADYLAYALLDTVIDSYFAVVDLYADRLEALDEAISLGQGRGINEQIHDVRSDLLLLRRAVRPHRDAVNELIRDEHPLISDETRVYLRDCYDHTVQLTELLELYRETCSDLRDFHFSLMSGRMNEIMKVLTIIATIFIPLGFIAGVYGMNFDPDLPGNMPELKWPYGYVFALCLMLLAAGGMVFYFWRKGWIGWGRASPERPDGG